MVAPWHPDSAGIAGNERAGVERVFVGTSSWSDQGPFYPPGTKPAEQLSFYARYFPIVEINTTYYHIPRRSLVDSWVERTPPSFRFDVKPPRELTSTPAVPGGVAPEPDAEVARLFFAAIAPLAEAGKLGAITFQFPPSYRNTPEHQEYIQLLPELFPGVRLAVEFRRRDWLDDEHTAATFDLLAEAGLSYTMVDEPQAGSGSVPPVYAVTNRNLAIIRFHGRNARTWYSFGGGSEGRFDWDYAPAELAEWEPRIAQAANEADEVHLLFNTNRGDGQGVRNARRLMSQLGLPVPPLPEQPRQAELL